MAPENLVLDRFAEFKRLAFKIQDDNSSSSSNGSRNRTSRSLFLNPRRSIETSSKIPTKSPQGATLMREFFEDCADIQSQLGKGRQGVANLNIYIEEGLRATTREQQHAASLKFSTVSEDITSQVSTIKVALQAIKEKCTEDGNVSNNQEALESKDIRNLPTTQRTAPTASECRIMTNMHQALGRKHQQLLLDFQKVQLEYKGVLQNQQEREMRLLCPEADQNELHAMIEAGANPSQLIVRKMAGAHSVILDEIQRINQKHQDILRLEQSCQELAQMFQEVAILVDAQGELLDSIEVHIHNTKDTTAKAVTELEVAKKVQSNTWKWSCCLFFLVLIVTLAVLFPVLFTRI